MRRNQVQKIYGAEWDWTCKRPRRITRCFRRSGCGKFWKKQLARHRRRELVDHDH
jgi:hypothetical protein